MSGTLLLHTLSVLGTWRLRRCVAGFLMSCILLGGHAQAAAPSATSITSSGLGTIVTPTNATTTTITGGTRPGNGPNLFHSFGDFIVKGGDTANFFNETSLATNNIIGRVTGGKVSDIYGTIRIDPTFGSASLYLINPAGIVFGSTASLNVGGAVHFSTADYLRLTDGTRFNVIPDPPADALLTSAPVAAFGFLDRSQASYGSIMFSQGSFQVPSGKTLALVGGNLDVNGATLQALSGRVELVSIVSAGEVPAGQAVGAAAPSLDAFAALGTITLNNRTRVTAAADTAAGTPGGQVVIRGGALTIDNSSAVLAGTAGNLNAPVLALDIAVRDGVLVDHSSVVSVPNNTISFTTLGSGNAGALAVSAATLELRNSASLFANYQTNGNGADLRIRVGSFRLTDGALIELRNLGSGNTGNGGTIDIQATQSMMIGSKSTVKTENFRGQGSGSPILIMTPQLVIEGGTSAGQGAGINAITGGNGPASSVVLSVNTLELRSGQASIDTRARDVSVTPTAPPQLGGGPITVQGLSGTGTAAELVSLSGRLTAITTVTEGQGTGGPLTITANRIVVADQAKISGSTESFKDRGEVVQDGQGGNIFLNVDVLEVRGGGSIQSSTIGTNPFFGSNKDIPPANGNGGLIDVRGISGGSSSAKMISVSGQDSFEGVSRLITETTQAGIGGTIRLQADQVILSDHALVSATAALTGEAGAIIMDVGSLTLRGQSAITSSSTSLAVNAGNGGNITLTAGQNLSLLEQSRVTATSAGGQLLLQNGQLVSAGNAGTLALTAGDTLLLSNSTIATTATKADGGDIKLTAPNLIRLDDSRVESSVGGGALTTGGNINIDPQAVVLKNSQVLANAFQGTGGNIIIAGNVVLVDPASVIDASSQQGVSGQVLIQAPVSNLAAALSRLTQQPLNAAELLTARCAARLREGQVSSLTVAGRDGVPPEPGSYSPGSLMADLARVAAASPRPQPAPGTQYSRIGGDITNPSAALLIQGPFGTCKA